MDGKKIKQALVDHCPEIPALRRAITKKMISKRANRLLPDAQTEAGEASFAEKARIVDSFERQNLPRIRRRAQMIEKTLERMEEDQALSAERREELRTDMMFCYLAYGFLPEEYLCYELEDKDLAYRRSFINEYQHMIYTYRMNDVTQLRLFNDKAETYRLFAPYFKRDALILESRRDLPDFRAFVEKYPVFVRKLVDASMGRGVSRIDLTGADDAAITAAFSDMIRDGKVLLEELIRQHETMARLNRSSVNTIRCITFNTRDGIETPYCFMKVGRAGSFVDNGGAGGILVGIDEQGICCTDGFDEMNRRYPEHPDSGVKFIGYPMPEWDEALQMCREMAARTPRIKFIGWDLAYSDKGWVVVEGNGMSQFIGPQTTLKRGINGEVLEIMSRMQLVVS